MEISILVVSVRVTWYKISSMKATVHHRKGRRAFLTALIMFSAFAFSSTVSDENATSPSALPKNHVPGRIYLYGEQHGVQSILSKEFELWREYYHNKGMRHLFVELPYYTAEFLNAWMKEEGDAILDAVYNDGAGTASQTPATKEFYRKIKKECPETVFHGTDVGHQGNTTGKRFLNTLERSRLKYSVQYMLALENIRQGATYYKSRDALYRENTLVKNFIREFDALRGESIMGIYGTMHIALEPMHHSGQSVPSMASLLKKRYGEAIHTEDLSWMAKDIQSIRIESITINDKTYFASYYGRQDLSWLGDNLHREFRRLENTFEDFKDNPKTGDVLPYSNYPMLIQTGQVFVIDYTKKDGSTVRMYYRSDGNTWRGELTTEQFIVK